MKATRGSAVISSTVAGSGPCAPSSTAADLSDAKTAASIGKLATAVRWWAWQEANKAAAAALHSFRHNCLFRTRISVEKRKLDDDSRMLRKKVRDAARLALGTKMLKNEAWNNRTKQLRALVMRWRVAAHCQQQILLKSSEVWFESGFMPVPIAEWHDQQKALEDAEGLLDRWVVPIPHDPRPLI